METRTYFADSAYYSTKHRYYLLESKPELLVDREKPLYRIDSDLVAPPLEPVTRAMLLGIDVVVVSDYEKGSVSESFLQNLVVMCQFMNIPLFIDSKKRNLGYVKYGFVKVNKLEAAQMLQQPPQDNFIVTLGEEGALYKEVVHPGVKTHCVDVCGAGDSFLAALAFGYLQFKGNISEAIRLANLAASCSVQHSGTYAPKLKELDINNAKFW